MFCPGALKVVFGVGVCALLIGCATEPRATELTRYDRAKSMDTALADNHTRLIAVSDSLSNADAVQTARPVTREEIIEWSIRGFSDDVIIDRIDRSNCAFRLSASEEIHLRDAGVSDEVIRAMKATAG